MRLNGTASNCHDVPTDHKGLGYERAYMLSRIESRISIGYLASHLRWTSDRSDQPVSHNVCACQSLLYPFLSVVALGLTKDAGIEVVYLNSSQLFAKALERKDVKDLLNVVVPVTSPQGTTVGTQSFRLPVISYLLGIRFNHQLADQMN